MPRFRLPQARGNVRGLKKEEEDKVSLFYSEPDFDFQKRHYQIMRTSRKTIMVKTSVITPDMLSSIESMFCQAVCR